MDRVQILSVGSPHGDDQVGWLVAELLQKRGIKTVFMVQSVDQLLTHLLPNCKAIIVDACQSGAPIGTLFRFLWPDPRIEKAIGCSSHGINLAYALRLAEVLGKLPTECVLFAIEIPTPAPMQRVGSEVEAAAIAVADQIELELGADVGNN